MTSEHDTALIRPTDIDILCGRGKSYSNHPGNSKFTKTIQSNLQKYGESPKRIDRSLLLVFLVEEFLDTGSRFLKKNKAASNEWIELDADQCHEKVGHALRDLARKTKRNKNNNLQSQSSAAIATSKKQEEQRQHMEQQQQHNYTNRRNLSLIMTNPLDCENVRFVAGHTIPESPTARFVSDDDDDIIVPPSRCYYSRNSFRPSVDFNILENRHDLTLEESLANFKF
jgi:hypothetical protein